MLNENFREFVSMDNARWLHKCGIRENGFAYVKLTDLEVFIPDVFKDEGYGSGYRNVKPGSIIRTCWLQSKKEKRFTVPAPTLSEACDFIGKTMSQFKMREVYNSYSKEYRFEIIIMDAVVILEAKPAVTEVGAFDNLLSNNTFRQLYESDGTAELKFL